MPRLSELRINFVQIHIVVRVNLGKLAKPLVRFVIRLRERSAVEQFIIYLQKLVQSVVGGKAGVQFDEFLQNMRSYYINLTCACQESVKIPRLKLVFIKSL